jgi:hypothetical protein
LVVANWSRSRRSGGQPDTGEIVGPIRANTCRLWRGKCRRFSWLREGHAAANGTDLLPAGAETLNEPFRAFPSWFLRLTCDRCGKERMFSETHAAHGDMLMRGLLDRLRHGGCGNGALLRRRSVGSAYLVWPELIGRSLGKRARAAAPSL